MRRALVGFAAALLLAAGATRQAAAEDPSAAAQSSMNHAAVVIDTGDGTVRKLCLAFPEAEISGIEALQRVDTRPHRFETFNGKGTGVCMLCGVGCESGDCFCSRTHYWAYHRAGPGETSYRTSAVGASSTVVRNGDVEAWKWGTGGAPAKTSVSEVCGVPEPPSRTASATTTTAAPPPTTVPRDESPTTSVSPSPGPVTSTPPPAAPTPAAPGPAATGTPTTTPPPLAGTPEASEAAVAPESEVPDEEVAAPAAEVTRSLGAEDVAAPAAASETSAGQLATLAAFTALLGGLLVWKARLRRAKVRRVRPVR